MRIPALQPGRRALDRRYPTREMQMRPFSRTLRKSKRRPRANGSIGLFRADARSNMAVGNAGQGVPRPHPQSRGKIMNRRNTLAAISASLLLLSLAMPAGDAAAQGAKSLVGSWALVSTRSEERRVGKDGRFRA